jgi:copper chaperone
VIDIPMMGRFTMDSNHSGSLIMIELNVKKMSCGHCVQMVTGALKSVDKDAAVRIDLQTGRVSVESRAPAAELAAAVTGAGYPAAPWTGTAAASSRQGGGCCNGRQKEGV